MSTERRLFAGSLPPEGGDVTLAPEAVRHAHVLRLREGDEVTLFDGRGARARGVLVSLDATSGVARTGAPHAELGDAARTTLVQCLPRGGKLDDLVRAATELGVTAIRLATSAHAVARGDDERWERRQARLDRVVREAARQAELDTLPEVHAPGRLLEIAALAPANARRFVLCGRTGSPLGAVDSSAEAWLVVGPEGGLAESELSALAAMGYVAISLGATILRVETAVVAAISTVNQARKAT